MGHTWGTKLLEAHLGHTWGTVGADTAGDQLEHTWGTVEAKNDLKHSLCKLNTLGAHLGHKVTWGTLGADTVWDQLVHIWDKNCQ